MLQNLDSKPPQPANQWHFNDIYMNTGKMLKLTLQSNLCTFQH